jgi:hypothetical protein
LGSGANNTARYLGGAAGIAIVVALAVPTSARPTTSQFVAGWDTAATVCAVLCAMGILAALSLREAVTSNVAGAPSEQTPLAALPTSAGCRPLAEVRHFHDANGNSR